MLHQQYTLKFKTGTEQSKCNQLINNTPEFTTVCVSETTVHVITLYIVRTIHYTHYTIHILYTIHTTTHYTLYTYSITVYHNG